MLNIEASYLLDTAIDPLFNQACRRKYQLAQVADPNPAKVLPAYLDETDDFIIKAEQLITAGQSVDSLIKETSEMVIFCTMYRFYSIQTVLKMSSKTIPCKYEFITKEHPLSGALITAWKAL